MYQVANIFMISLGREAQLLDVTQVKHISYMTRAGISSKKTVKVIAPYLIYYVLWPHICGSSRCGNYVIVKWSLFVICIGSHLRQSNNLATRI